MIFVMKEGGEDRGRNWMWWDLLGFVGDDTCQSFKGETEKGTGNSGQGIRLSI